MNKKKKNTKKNSDTLTDIGLTGLGLAAMTKKEIDKFIDDLMKKSELSKNEGKKMFKDLSEKSKKEQKKLENNINAQINKVLKTMDVARQKDIKRLENKIDKLSKSRKK